MKIIKEEFAWIKIIKKICGEHIGIKIQSKINGVLEKGIL